MKILQKGHDEDKMTVHCSRCEAIFEVSSLDLKKTNEAYEWKYTCPCCDSSHVVEWGDLTNGVQRAIYIQREA